MLEEYDKRQDIIAETLYSSDDLEDFRLRIKERIEIDDDEVEEIWDTDGSNS